MSMVPLVSSAEELPEAFRYATLHPSSRWYVASRARAFNQAESIPVDWQLAEPVVAAVQQFTDAEREQFAKQHVAMADGSYPIPDRAHIRAAVNDYNRTDAGEDVKKHIIQRAVALDATDDLPPDWVDPDKDSDNDLIAAKDADNDDAAYRRKLGLTADASDEVVALVAAHFDKAAEDAVDVEESAPDTESIVADGAENSEMSDAREIAQFQEEVVASASEMLTEQADAPEPAIESVTAAATISDKPWSDFTASDYTPEQYKHACLVAKGDTKDECHLPVREPDGTLNRNGVHAAAASLAGARGGVNLSPEQRKVAIRKIKSLYHQLGEDVPDSLTAALGTGFNDTKHPRGSDGKFIEVDGRVVVSGHGEGNVSEIYQDSAGVTHIVVLLDGGQKFTTTSDQISQAPDAKAHLPEDTSHKEAKRGLTQGGPQSTSGRVDAFRKRAQARRALQARVAAATARPVPTGHPDVDHSIDVHPIHGVARSLMNKKIRNDPATEHARVDSILKEADPALARQQLDRLMAEAKLSGHQRSRYRSLLSQHHESALRGLDDVEVSAQARKFPAGTPEGDAARTEANRRLTERVAPAAPFDRPGHGRPEARPAEALAASADAAI